MSVHGVECWDWTIPTPRGLWYRAIVAAGSAMFVTSEIDVTTLKHIRQASKVSARDVASVLMEHGRFKRPELVKLADIKALRVDRSTGLFYIETINRSISVRVPDRVRLDALAGEVGNHVRSVAAGVST